MGVSSRTVGFLTVFFSGLFFYLGTLPIRWEKDYGTLGGNEFISARFLLGALLILIFKLKSGRFPRPDKPLILAGRVVAHFLAGWLYFLCIERSNAALGNVLHMTYPLFAAILVLAAGKSKTPFADLGLATLSVLGIALICDLSGEINALALGLASGLAGAFSIILLSSSRAGNSTLDIFFYTFLGGFLLSFLVARPDFTIHHPMEWVLLGASALFGILGQLSFTYGAAFISPVETSIVSCLRIPLTLFGATIGLESTSVTHRAWIGAVMVFIANVIVARRKDLKLKKIDELE